MGTPGIPLDKARILRAIEDTNGVLTEAAKILNCDRTAIQQWARRDEEVKNAIAEARSKLDDVYLDDDTDLVAKARSSLHYLVEKKSVKAVCYVLDHNGGSGHKNLVQSANNATFIVEK